MLVLDTRTVYELLGIPAPTHIEDDPEPRTEEVVVWYPGWTLEEMIANAALRSVIDCPSDLLRIDATLEAVASGWHALRIPMAGSQGKTFEEQAALLREGERSARTRLAAFTLAVHLLIGDPPLLPEGIPARCGEAGEGTCRTVRITERRLQVGSGLNGRGRIRMISSRSISLGDEEI